MQEQIPKKLGLIPSTALVIGNMVGSGIFLLPASLAVYGYMGLAGWMCSFGGAMILSFIFGNLSKLFPSASGGPYEYTKRTFGLWPAYIVAWCYWTSIWFANAAIVVALLGYLNVFFPIINEHVIITIITGWAFIWLFTWINTKGILLVGKVQVITTIFKLIPLIIVGFFGLFYVDFTNIDLNSTWNFPHLTSAVTLTFFAYQGMESAAITSDQVGGDETMVKTATVFGTLFTSIIYILSSFVVMALVDGSILSQSTSPFAEASSLFLGSGAKYFVALGAIFSTCGALNGWILVQGHIPMAAAQDNLFPKVFGIRNQEGSPSQGIIITSIITSILLLLNYIKGLVSLFTLLISLSTLAVMVPYLFSVAAYLMISIQRKDRSILPKIFLSLIAFLFLGWVVVGSGLETIIYGLSFVLAGILFYFATQKFRIGSI